MKDELKELAKRAAQNSTATERMATLDAVKELAGKSDPVEFLLAELLASHYQTESYKQMWLEWQPVSNLVSDVEGVSDLIGVIPNQSIPQKVRDFLARCNEQSRRKSRFVRVLTGQRSR